MVCSHESHKQQSHAMHGERQQDNLILCPQCDMLVALPPLQSGSKAVCPRCKTTLSARWQKPRKQPIGFALSALFMLVLANIFPFINMRVAGLGNEIKLIPNSSGDGGRRLCQHGHPVYGVCATDPGVLHVGDYSVVCQGAAATTMEDLDGQGAVPVEDLVHGRDLSGWRVLVSFVKLMAYGDIGIGSSFIPYCLFCLLQVRAFQCVDRRWLWQDIEPAPVIEQPLQVGRTGLRQGVRSCSCCTAILPAQQSKCPRCHTVGYVRRRHSLQWTMALIGHLDHIVYSGDADADYDHRGVGNKMPSTVMAGVVLLWGEGSYPVAMVIFHCQYYGALAQDVGDWLVMPGCQWQRQGQGR
ncbi:paraquat-inducible membrane protein A [Serratia fonticola]|uniref:Paraquat-inducible membrane protein A n=1 Tax=Serratia fonticola TaxID=47917 RepID=A0A4V6KQG7_SERFO|nr:paraquat-inducible membrane protein A [Serratia fonticola]